jgi:serine/threonine protein kinase
MQFQDPEVKTVSPELKVDDEPDGKSKALVVSAHGENDAPAVPPAAPQTAQAISAHTAPDAVDIPGYHLREVIGRGSSGSVWRATDPHGATVAVKVFSKELSSNPDNSKRILQEVKNLKRISHPNVVSVLDSGETTDHSMFIAMEYVKGQTVKSLLEEDGVFESQRATTIAREVCRALTAAHGQTIIHRDLKPSNIVVTEENTAKLIDFGVAKASGYSGETITQLGDIVGTPEYMSPEQCLGGLVDERSDIYSLGCTLFEMLTGMKAFPSANAVEAIAKQISNDRSDIHTGIKATHVSPKLQQIVIKCLEREPSKRFQSAAELEHDLGAYLLGVPLRFTGKHSSTASQKRLIVSAGLAACVFIGLVGFFGTHLPVNKPEPDQELRTSLPAQARPSASLDDFKKWLDAQLAQHAQKHPGASVTALLEAGMESAFKKTLVESPPLHSDTEGVIYFTLGTDGSAKDMRAVGWKNSRGVVAAWGPNIQAVEESMIRASFPKLSAPKDMVLLYNATEFCFKDISDVPPQMRLNTSNPE